MGFVSEGEFWRRASCLDDKALGKNGWILVSRADGIWQHPDDIFRHKKFGKMNRHQASARTWAHDIVQSMDTNPLYALLRCKAEKKLG